MARKLRREQKVHFRAPLEVRNGISWEAGRISKMFDIKITGEDGRWRYASDIYLLNWIACHFLSQPEGERNRIALAGRKIFEERMESDRPRQFASEDAPPSSVVEPEVPAAATKVGKPAGNSSNSREPGDRGDGKPRRGKDQSRGADRPAVVDRIPVRAK